MLIIVVVFPFKIFAQEIIPLEEPRKPVMESVFWNTFMGSIWGGVMGVAYMPANPIRQPSFQGGRIKPQSEYILGRMDQKKSLKNQIELTIFQIQF